MHTTSTCPLFYHFNKICWWLQIIKNVTDITRFRGLNPGVGEMFHTFADLPWGLTSLLLEYLVIPGGNTAGAWRWPPTSSCAEVKERVPLLPLCALMAGYGVIFAVIQLLPSAPCSGTVSAYTLFFIMRDRGSHPYKITGPTISLFILNFMLFVAGREA
jgi:hypothetical protein